MYQSMSKLISNDLIEDLTDDQLAELKEDLLALQDSLQVSLAATQDRSAPVKLDQAAVGRLSRMDAMQAQQMAKANRSQFQLRLAQIAQALRLIAEDRYGLCRACDEPIGYPRLKARPETPFCLVCQNASEKR
jgi:DnaK suppressor protein